MKSDRNSTAEKSAMYGVPIRVKMSLAEVERLWGIPYQMKTQDGTIQYT